MSDAFFGNQTPNVAGEAGRCVWAKTYGSDPGAGKGGENLWMGGSRGGSRGGVPRGGAGNLWMGISNLSTEI